MLALEAGADMYMAKPLDLEELVTRVQVCLRKGDGADCAVGCGELTLTPTAHRAAVGEQALALTPKEFHLLQELLKAEGRVCSSAHLLWEVWGYPPALRTRTLDVHVGRLRAKLAEAGARECRLVTVSGVGYRLLSGAD